MRCFNHPETEAIGTCKACNKGLCLECAADLGHGLACKSAHVEAVEDLNTLVARNVRIGNINARGKISDWTQTIRRRDEPRRPASAMRRTNSSCAAAVT